MSSVRAARVAEEQKSEDQQDALTDILKASGVIEDDVESQITQLTAISQQVPEDIMAPGGQTEQDQQVREDSSYNYNGKKNENLLDMFNLKVLVYECIPSLL